MVIVKITGYSYPPIIYSARWWDCTIHHPENVFIYGQKVSNVDINAEYVKFKNEFELCGYGYSFKYVSVYKSDYLISISSATFSVLQQFVCASRFLQP